MSSNIAITTVGGAGSGGGLPGGSGGGSSGSGGVGGGGGGPCGACKFLRRKCVSGCIFAPYFDSEQGTSHFAAVHKVFGASNVSKMLQHVPVHKRLDAVVTICYEAQSRLRNPVYGCVAHIFALQQEVVNLQGEIAYLQAHLANLELQPPPAQPQPQPQAPPPHFSVFDLPTASTMPASYDLSSLIFDPVVQWPQPVLHHNQPSDINNAGRDQHVTLAIPQPSDHNHASSSRVVHQSLPSDHPLLVRQSSSPAGAHITSFTMQGSCSDTQRPGSQPK